jgi:hypothetical protein
VDQTTVDLWFRYEEIAMHFNTLLMQYRLQLMGGIGAIGTAASVLIAYSLTEEKAHARVRALVSGGMLVLIASAAALDVFYYNRLLAGAVAALLRFEKEHPELYMSTAIEAWTSGGSDLIHWVYGVILALLAAFVAWAWCRYLCPRPASLVSKPLAPESAESEPRA